MKEPTTPERDAAAAGVAHFQIVAQPEGRYHWQLTCEIFDLAPDNTNGPAAEG